VNSSRAFLAQIVDYAGIFPPAELDMSAAVEEYDRRLAGDDGDLMGRFVVSASRLNELTAALHDRSRENLAAWRVSATVNGDLEAALQTIDAFNAANHAVAKCDSVELPVSAVTDVDAAARTFGARFDLFLETPVRDDPAQLIDAIASRGASAKMRTGGVVASAFPSSRAILRFMRCCIDARVPFKATAGLHHAVRGRYPLTYEPGAERALMHGYLNVFLAAAFCFKGAFETALSVLDEEDASSFRFDENGAQWRTSAVTSAELTMVRADVARSFGSCSFTEPVGEARQLQIIR
jgi:hypothetical protein